MTFSVCDRDTHLRDQGLPTDREYLFVIDGAKALRARIEEYSAPNNPSGGAGITNYGNVPDELPGDQQGETRLPSGPRRRRPRCRFDSGCQGL